MAWLAVNLSGSVARVEVKERTLPPTPTDPNRPSNIRAARDGRIIEFSVYGGEAAVQNGDAVTEGMLLVSGVIEGEKGTILRLSLIHICNKFINPEAGAALSDNAAFIDGEGTISKKARELYKDNKLSAAEIVSQLKQEAAAFS